MKSLEALWAIRFGPIEAPVSGGVLIFETGNIYGGDTMYAYVGGYVITPRGFDAVVTVVKHFEAPRMIDLWESGSAKFEVNVSATKASDDSYVMSINREEFPSVDAHLVRVIDLP